MKMLRNSVLSLICGIALVACGGAPTLRPESTPTGKPLAATKDTVGRVLVSVSDDVGPEGKQVLETYHVAKVLGDQIVERTGQSGKVTLNVKIKSVRLRSNFSAFMWGPMAGPDVLDVSISAEKNG